MTNSLTNRAHNGAKIIEDARVRRRLLGIVIRLERNSLSREDLMQEALVHVWLEAERRPGQTLSWYMKSCSFHLQHLLASGRSVDSPKRRCCQTDRFEPDGEIEDPIDSLNPDDNLVSEVSAHEIFGLLAGRLKAKQRIILQWLVDGVCPSEISRRLNVSHAAVIKFRKKVARMSAEIGLAP